MDRDEIVAIARDAIESNVQPTGSIRIPVLSASAEQVAIDVIDALESAGFRIVKSAV